MAIRESDCQNWNDATSIQQYNQLKGVQTSDLDLSYQKSGPGTVLDDAIFQGIYSPEDAPSSYSSMQLDADSSVQLEADDMDLALPLVIDNNGEIHLQKDESADLVYTSLQPCELSQHTNNLFQPSTKQVSSHQNIPFKQQHNEEYMIFDHQDQILTAVESDGFDRSFIPQNLPGIESTFGGSRNRSQFMSKNKRISESSDSSGQGGALSENDSTKYDDNPLSSPSADVEQIGALDEKKQQQGGQQKWVSRPLIKDCRICNSPATSVQHYGSISCYSCRAFFRRTVGSQREYLKCSRGDDSCTVDAVNRTNCKKCRYKKCIKVGMRPEKVDRVVRKREAMKSEDSTALPTKRGSSNSTALPTHCEISDADSNNVDAEMQNLPEEKKPISKQTITESQQNNLLEETDTEMKTLSDKKVEKHESYVEYSNPMQDYMHEDINMISDNKAGEVSPKLTDLEPLNIEGSKLAELEPLDIEKLMNDVYNEGRCNKESGSVSKNSNDSPADKFFDFLNESNSIEQEGTCTGPNPVKDSDMKTKAKLQNLYTSDASKKLYNNRFSIPFGDIDSIDLTIEEEFRIYSLMAKRQQLFSTLFTVLKRLPRFIESVTSFFSAISAGYECITTVLPNSIPISFLPGLQKLNISQIMRFSRIIRIDCENEIDIQTKLKMMTLSLPALEILTRGIIHGNTDKGTFINQHAAAGTLNPVFEEVIKEVKGFEEVKSFSPLNLDIFTSPWAVCLEDEEKFTNTMNEIGDLIKDDKKLGCLYFFLVLLSPVAVNAGQVHPEFAKMQKVLSLLTYRYIKSKTKDTSKANSIMDRLRRLIKDLHECADIHRNRRIFRPFEFPKFDEMLEALDKTIVNI